jgi:hypothetical protein
MNTKYELGKLPFLMLNFDSHLIQEPMAEVWGTVEVTHDMVA